MKTFSVLFFLFPIFLFSQNNSILNFEDLKHKIELNKIDLNDLGKNNENNLNKTEIKVISLLNNSDHDLSQNEITFITGSNGKSISNKLHFFNSFKNHYSKNTILSYTIVKLDEKSSQLSSTDYIVYFWVKTYNSKSKKLLKRIKQTKQT